jgi:hypothetical protein
MVTTPRLAPFGVQITLAGSLLESTGGSVLANAEVRLRKPRPVLARADPAQQKKHKKNSAN